MSQINQYEDFQSVGHVVYVLGEFVLVNAAFSFATDAVTQKIEGKWFCCKPTIDPPEDERVETKQAAETPDESGAAAAPTATPPPAASAPVPVKYDVVRSCRFAITGVFFCGVVQFIRLAVIDVIFDRKDTSMRAALMKTGMNQLVFSPIVRAWSMMTVRFFYERSRGKNVGDSWDGACANLRAKFCEAQGISYMVKPVSNFLAFVIFPNHILGQAVVMRAVAFVYNVYFDYVLHIEQDEEEAAEAKKNEAGGEEEKDAETAPDAAGAPREADKKARTGTCCCGGGCAVM
eukprot:TRINITY_DN30546_c0_g1_i1.p1 TRINITY_DN30546_c0_g1~~TRINITY_DN30546_c0_g1_i1.p1  ORF type:complete len:290 (+),score=68.53 TRINITY_DN30546_c0_g1_i1:155-1024(+)